MSSSQLNTYAYKFSRPPSSQVSVGFETLELVAKQWYEGLKILILLFQWICEWASSACCLNLTAPSICKRLAQTKSAHDGFRASWWFLTMGSPQVQHEKFLPRLGYWSLFYGHISSDPQATTNLSPTISLTMLIMSGSWFRANGIILGCQITSEVFHWGTLLNMKHVLLDGRREGNIKVLVLTNELVTWLWASQ